MLSTINLTAVVAAKAGTYCNKIPVVDFRYSSGFASQQIISSQVMQCIHAGGRILIDGDTGTEIEPRQIEQLVKLVGK